jgi:hypothetical protein
MIIAATLQAKYDPNKDAINMQGVGGLESEESSTSELLVSDSIMNYKTVASFGSDELILAQYKQNLDSIAKDAQKKAYVHGIAFGFS